VARAVIINVSGIDSENGVADETLVAGPWDPATIGIAGGVNLDFFPAIYSEDFTPGGSTGFFLGHWADGFGGQFSAIKVNIGFIGDYVIQSPYLYSLSSGTPTVSPNDGIVLSAVTDQAGLTVYEDANKRIEIGYLSAGVFGIKANNTSGNLLFEISDTRQVIGRIEIDDESLFSTGFVSGQQGFKIFDDGSAEFENITARGEFRSSIIVQDEIHALGGQFMANTAGLLLNDMITVSSPTQFSMRIKDPPSGHAQLFAVNDLVRVKDGSGKDNFIRVDSVSDSGDHYLYTCTLQNGTAGTFYIGTAIVYWGNTTVGNLLNIVGVGADAPYMDIFSHTGSPWSSTSTNLRIGNLDGVTDADFTNLGGYGLYADNIFLKGSYQSSAGSGQRITLNEDEGSGANNAMIFYEAGGTETVRIDDTIHGSAAGIRITVVPGITTEITGAQIEIVSSIGAATPAILATLTSPSSVVDTGVVRGDYDSSEADAFGLLRAGIWGRSVISHVSATSDAVGIYGTATNSGSGAAYAGYFAAGDVYIADNLGVGTDSPQFFLDIGDSVSQPGIRTLGFTYNGIRMDTDSANAAARNYFAGANFTVFGDYGIVQSNAKDGDPVAAGTTRFYIDSAGNVGIGTSSPSELLEVEKDHTLPTGIRVDNPDTGAGVNSLSKFAAASSTALIEIISHGGSRVVTRYGVTVADYAEVVATAGDGLLIGTFTNATPIIFGTNNAERMRIDSSGSVGIGGIPATSALLDLQSTTGALLVPRMTTTQRNALTPVDGMVIYNITTNAFNFHENTLWRTGSGLV